MPPGHVPIYFCVRSKMKILIVLFVTIGIMILSVAVHIVYKKARFEKYIYGEILKSNQPKSIVKRIEVVDYMFSYTTDSGKTHYGIYYELSPIVELPDGGQPKQFIDKLGKDLYVTNLFIVDIVEFN